MSPGHKCKWFFCFYSGMLLSFKVKELKQKTFELAHHSGEVFTSKESSSLKTDSLSIRRGYFDRFKPITKSLNFSLSYVYIKVMWLSH